MPSIPGITLPGTYSDVVTESRGVAIPGTNRVAAIMGEGSTDEVVITSAVGGGKDGVNSLFTSTTNADSRHFQLRNFPLIENRTVVYKNGVRLVGLEAQIDSSAFSSKYDYRLDPATGRLELQKAHLVDQGGTNYKTLTTNTGLGTLSSLTLLDLNAPPETWTIRCVGVQRDVSNNPVPNTAKFLAFGSISGTKLDANGNPIVWIADGYTVSNGILEFAIVEDEVLSVVTSPFKEGDAFIVQVKSGALVKNDSLTTNYIPSLNINDPVFLNGMDQVSRRHGSASLSNNLSLGAQLAFANGAPGVMTVQTAPAMPRRQSFVLVDSFVSDTTNLDNFTFPLPVGVTPDANSNIHFFVKDNVSNVETQILPNKLDFYLLGTTGYPTKSQFIQDNIGAPSGYSFYYTVVQDFATVASDFDGYLARNLPFNNKGIFTSPDGLFDASYVGKSLKVIDAVNTANNGTFTITAVQNGNLYFNGPTNFAAFTSESSVAFSLIDPITDEVVASSSATNGVLTPGGTDTATFTSGTINFNSFAGLTGLKLKITSTTNNGTYDITGYNNIGNVLSIKKAFVIETGLRYEIIDTLDETNYVVVNKNVVPVGNQLRVTLIDDKDAAFYDAGWINALDSLEKVECDIVVPLPKQTISVIFQNALAHCRTMSNITNKKERVLFSGAIRGLTPDNLNGLKDAAVEDIGILEGIQGDSVTEVLSGNIEDLANYSVADAFGNTFRNTYFYPDEIVMQAGTENALVDGFYQAAAAAGYLASTPRIEIPLTNKVLSGFTILRNKQLSNTTITALANNGVTVLQPVTGGGLVKWGITTSQSGYVEEKELSIVFIRDRVAKILRSGFQGYVGNPEDANTAAILNTRAVILLNSLVSSGIITAYRDIVVLQDEADPTQYNIKVAIRPNYPVNFIYIRISIGQ